MKIPPTLKKQNEKERPCALPSVNYKIDLCNNTNFRTSNKVDFENNNSINQDCDSEGSIIIFKSMNFDSANETESNPNIPPDA